MLAAVLAAVLLVACSDARREGDVLGPTDGAGAEPVGLLLTWQRDPTTTMTIDWHTEQRGGGVLEYRVTDSGGWRQASPNSFGFPTSSRWVHRVELTGLQPDTEYQFRIGGSSQVRLFRTMPRTLSRPVRFVAGGDMRHQSAWMERTTRQAAVYDADFALLGGDLAYGHYSRPDEWHDWFRIMQRALATPAGRVIPVLATIGNHEVDGGFIYNLAGYQPTQAYRERVAPHFYQLFATPGQPGYNVVDFGNYLSVILLDSDHTNWLDGEQTRWLERTLQVRQAVRHIIPIYHLAAYPAARDSDIGERIRTHWVPLFERYGVKVAFENHDHTYKRTYPLRGGQRHDDGIVYLGDGAWGVSLREPIRDGAGRLRSYVAHAEAVRHFFVGEIDAAGARFIAVDERGNVFDEYPPGSRSVIGSPRWSVELADIAERLAAADAADVIEEVAAGH